MWTPAHFYAELHRIAWNCANFDTIITEWGVPGGAGECRGVPHTFMQSCTDLLGIVRISAHYHGMGSAGGRRGVPGSAGEKSGPVLGEFPLIFPSFSGVPGSAGEIGMGQLARGSQEEPGKARRSQGEPGGVRRSPEELQGAPRGAKEPLGVPRSP